jgi:putative ABC transport system substrate-binding protein
VRRREFIGLICGALAGPLSGQAEQRVKVPRIAIVSPSDPIDRMTEKGEGVGRWYAFFSELRRLGRTEGETLVVERHSGLGFTERYAELARHHRAKQS